MTENQQTTSAKWQEELRDAFKSPAELLDFIGLDAKSAPFLLELSSDFPFLVTRTFARRMARNNWHDPLLAQVLPLKVENDKKPGFGSDPVGDLNALSADSLLHKYQSRVLHLPTPACAIHCRYCFRRHFPATHTSHQKGLPTAAHEYLNKHSNIDEVILSGGDPLMLSDDHFEQLFLELAAIPSIVRIRIHTRIPIVLPSRIHSRFLDLLNHYSQRFTWIWVIHCNHPSELSADVCQTMQLLRQASHLLFNQSVLLRGVNDSADILEQLSLRLIQMGVIPYYLHQLDKVDGAAHFEVPESIGASIMESLRQRLPGYMVPKYVREEAGKPFKTPL